MLLLEYLYRGGEVDREYQKILVETDHLFEVFLASNKFMISGKREIYTSYLLASLFSTIFVYSIHLGLQTLCEDILENNLDIETVCSILDAGILLSLLLLL